MLKKLLLFIVLGFTLSSMAEQEIDYPSLDKETYRFYQEQKWDSLIDLGKIGIKQGFDYYYLRYRMGVAYYSLQNYIKAISHFEKAYEFNNSESSLLRYLYYSNYFLNRKKSAAFYASRLPDSKENNPIKKQIKFVDKIYLETAFIQGNDDQKHGNLNKAWTDSSIYLENQISGEAVYTHAGFKLNLSPRLSVYAGLSYIDKNKTSKFRYFTDLQLDSIVESEYVDAYYYSMMQQNRSFSSPINQTQIYFKADVLLGKDWMLSPFLQYIKLDYKKIHVNYRAIEEKAIEYYDKYFEEYNYFDYIKNEYTFTQSDTSMNDYILGFNLSHNFDYVAFSLGSSVSRLNLKDQFSFSGSLTYFPFGNLNFMGATGISYFHENNDQNIKTSKLLFSQMLGLKIFPWLWLEAKYLGGDLENTYWDYAFVVYNVYDKINYIAEVNLSLLLSKNLELSLRYQFREKQAEMIHYYNDYLARPTENTIETNYDEQMILGGIKWQF